VWIVLRIVVCLGKMGEEDVFGFRLPEQGYRCRISQSIREFRDLVLKIDLLRVPILLVGARKIVSLGDAVVCSSLSLLPGRGIVSRAM
jgi:hypothetical protein